MLPVPANWLDSLLTDTATTRTVTMVYEPIPLNKAAAAANRDLTSIESSHEDKARRGFRVTARERRRLADVEGREARDGTRSSRVPPRRSGHGDGPRSSRRLDDACAQIENAAGKSLIDLRPLVARQALGWVASLPLGRSFKASRRMIGQRRPCRRCGPPMSPGEPHATTRERCATTSAGAPRNVRSTPNGRRCWHAGAETIPVDWHRSTMAHLCAMYPFHADRSFGEAGVYFGINVTAGLDGFYYDPFEYYSAGLVENPNMMVVRHHRVGQVGHSQGVRQAQPGGLPGPLLRRAGPQG